MNDAVTCSIFVYICIFFTITNRAIAINNLDTCSNGVKDDNEADVDCGDECFSLCGIGMHCKNNYDCSSWKCNNITYTCIRDEKIIRFLSASGASGASGGAAQTTTTETPTTTTTTTNAPTVAPTTTLAVTTTTTTTQAPTTTTTTTNAPTVAPTTTLAVTTTTTTETPTTTTTTTQAPITTTSTNAPTVAPTTTSAVTTNGAPTVAPTSVPTPAPTTTNVPAVAPTTTLAVTTTGAPKNIMYLLPHGNFLYGNDNSIIEVPHDARNGPVFVKGKTQIKLRQEKIAEYDVDEKGYIVLIKVPTIGVCMTDYCEMWTTLNVTSPFKDIHIQAAPVYYIKSKCLNLEVKDPRLCKQTVPYLQYPRDKCLYVREKKRFCDTCPVGARCPGGKQLWALPGFGIIEKVIQQRDVGQFVFPCPEPSLRCLGYNETLRKEQCAEGYGGVLCAGCLEGYFSEPVGIQTCQVCPHTEPSSAAVIAIVIPTLILIGVLLLVFLFALAASYIAMRKRGGTVYGGLTRTVDFMFYVVSSVFLLCQISRKCMGHLPKYINDLAIALAVFVLDAPTIVSPECTPHPFLEEIFVFSVSIAVVILCLLMLNTHIYSSIQSCSLYFKLDMENFKYALFMCLWLMYPKICNLSLKSIYCVQFNGIFVLASNTLTRCYEGKHILVHNLAWTVLVAHGIFFPVASAWYIQQVLNRYLKSNSTYATELDNNADVKNTALCKDKKLWTYFFASKFKPRKFWFRQIKLLMVFVSAVCNEIFATHWVYSYAIVYLSMLALHSFFLAWLRPYAKLHRWKLYVCIYSHFCTTLYVVMNVCSSRAAFNGTFRKNLTWLAPLTMTLTILLFAVLCYAYLSTLFDGATIEEKEALEKQEYILRRSLIISPKMSAVINAINTSKNDGEEDGLNRRFLFNKRTGFVQSAKQYIQMIMLNKDKSNDVSDIDIQETGEMFSYNMIGNEPSES